MADNVFTLGVEIESKSAVAGLKDIQKELKNTSDAAKNVGKGFGESVDKINGELKGLAGNLQGLTGQNGIGGVVDGISGLTRGFGVATGAIVGITAVVGAATIALIANASAMAAAADDAAELADNLGITTAELAALNLLASETGTSTQSLVAGYDKVGKALNEVQDGNIDTENSFRRLGISMSDIAGKSNQQIAGIVVKNMQSLGSTTQAVAAAQDILGRNFRENLSAYKAAADGIDEYKKRTEGIVASRALEKAGADQEKALSDLKIAVGTVGTAFAEMFASTITDAAKWATEIAKSMSAAARSIGDFKEFYGSVSVEEIRQLRTQANKDTPFYDLVGAEKLFQERLEELRKSRVKARREFREKELAEIESENKRLLSRSAAVQPIKDKPKKSEQAKLTEEQKALAAVGQAAGDTLNKLNDQIKLNGVETDSTTQAVTKYAQELYKLGKGYLTVEQAGNIALGMQDKFRLAIESTNTAKFNDDVKKLNQSFDTQLQLLTATTEQQRQQIILRAQLSKVFENQKDGPTAAQAKALEEALAKANVEFAKLQSQRINNNVSDSLRDLTEQTQDLTYEVENYWRASTYGAKDTTVALNQLYRQLDPEGRGKNLSDQQKAALKDQLDAIEVQKRFLEQNRQIEDSFRSLGSAVSDWALGSKDAIKNVKLELIKLIALQALKSYGGTGNSIADLFIGGFISGLSGRASGGPVEAGKSYMVGEKGPEIVKFKQPGYVIPNHQISSASPRTTMLTVAPSLIIQGSVTGQSELDRAFEQFAGAMASETEKLIIRQRGNGILAR